MNSIPVSTISPTVKFSANVMLDDNFLLLPAHCVFTSGQLKELDIWGFKEVYCDGNPVEEKQAAAEESAPSLGSAKLSSSDTESVDVSDFIEDESGNAPSSKPEVKEKETPKAEPEKAVSAAPTFTINEADYEKAKQVYMDYMSYINSVYTVYATNKTLNSQEVTQQAQKLCQFIKDNRRYVLRIISTPSIENKNFLVNHSMRSTVVAVTIGIQLQFPEEKLVELAVACILHEIGMILLPPQIYMNDKPLSQPERLMMNTHPIVSFNILKKAEFSQNIQIAVLEHHEKINGSGYPRHVTGDKISIYAKIIALACSYEAITAPRGYKEERTAFEALIELVRNSSRQHDDIVTKALLYSVSLYPIGVYVYLSNGKIAQVVDVVEGNPKAPIVQILNENDENGNPKIVQVDLTRLKIIRVLNKKEYEDTLNALKKMNPEFNR